jgi:hypothetical protein
MNEMTIPVVEGSVIFSVDIGLSFLRNTNAEYSMRPLHCLLLALAIFQTGCAAQQQAQNSDPMLQRADEDWKVHGEVGAAYGQSAR